MKESTSKEKILKAIRDAQVEVERQQKIIDVDTRTPIYPPMQKPLDVQFGSSLSDTGAIFVYCEDYQDAGDHIRNVISEYHYDTVFTNEYEIEQLLIDGNIPFFNYEQGLKKAKVAVTFCECIVARSGTVVLSSRQKTGRKTHTLPEAHFVIAFKDQLVKELSDVYPYLLNKYEKNDMPSMITYITGASFTDAIQGEFVYGVNGSTRLFVFYIED